MFTKTHLIALVSLLMFMGCAQTKSVNETLFAASKQGNTNSIQKLIKKGADVNYVCKETSCQGWTPVMIASAENHPDAVKLLLEAGANPNVQNQYGRTALHFAVNYGFEPIVNLLLEYKADPTIKTFQNFEEKGKEPATPTEAAVRRAELTKNDKAAYHILKTLIYKTGEVNAEFEHSTPLMFALAANDYDFTKYLLEKGANPYHVIPETNPQGHVNAYYELDNLVLTPNNPASAKTKALFRSYNEKKIQEKNLANEGITNFQKLQKSVDDFVTKNGKLPTTSAFFKEAKINIPEGSWNNYNQLVTPHFTYGAICDEQGCSISLIRYGESKVKETYRLSAIKTADKIDTWQVTCSTKTNLGIPTCMAFGQYIKSLNVDISKP